MISYRSSVAERKRLEAADSARPLRNRLVHIEPLHRELYEEYSKTLEHVEELEKTIQEKEAELARLRKESEMQLKVSQTEGVTLQGKLRAVEMELLEIKSTTNYSAASLVEEKNTAVAKLADAQLEYQLIKDKSAALEAQVAELKEYFGASEKMLKAEIADYKKQAKALQHTHDKALKQAASEREELESQTRQLEAEKAAAEEKIEAATERQESAKVVKKEIFELKATITKDKNVAEKAEKDAAAAFEKVQKDAAAALEKVQKELSQLRTNLDNEIEARIQAEKEQQETREQAQQAQEEEQKIREKVEKDLERLQAAKEKAPSKASKKELSDLKAALEKETKAREQAEKEREEEVKIREKAEKDLGLLQAVKPAKEPAAKVTKKELAELRASLEKEAKFREKIEREYARLKEDHEAKLEILEKQLEASRVKAKKIEEAASKPAVSKSTTTKVPIDNPRKRPAANPLTMDDLENSVKRPRNKQATKESEFSITPFLKRQALVVEGDSTTAGDATAAPDESSMGGAGEKSIMIPSVIDSKQPARLLFAGAGRKKKPTKASTAILEEMEEAPVPEPEPEAALLPMLAQLQEEDNYEEEDSMLMVSAPIIAKAKAKGKAPAKPRGKAAAKPAAAAKAKPAKPRNALLDSSPVAPPPEKPVAKKAAPKPRKKAAAETSLRGIKPASFDDDGTGRIQLNFDDASQPNKVPSLVPKVGAFNKEISPPKRRPTGMKLFGKQ
ncbi:hypothetical protein BZA05DRAFT_394906 [Tricharina praecox]|uniref:uncharacterized protein n=1 Tax=Tricharina praecox TaxID=43433 RepID=UPI00221EAB27|nr:uncharacterized protein BZA05DRAFT_394906 [Tricharina praecox]KAI5853850.1 hypothetical protein BZA05DRAFT_394906 [Tricharina praecox]